MNHTPRSSAEINFRDLPKGRRMLRLTFLQATAWIFAVFAIIVIIAYLVRYELFIAVLVFGILGLYLLIPALGVMLLFSSSFSISRKLRSFTQQAKQESALLEAFAEQNDLSYGSQVTPQPESEPGSLFHFGINHTCDNAVGGEFMGLPYTLYQHEYFFGSRDAYNWRFENTVMEFTLPRTLPQFIIDSRLYSKGNTQSGLPLLFDRKQEIELEGTFSQYFRLYAPAKYQVSALAILTPDVMLAIMESGMECDIEIVGNKLYFYWPYMEPTAENYQTYYHVAEVFLKEVKKKLLVGNIYADEEQAYLHDSADPVSGVRLKPGLLARLNNRYSRLFQPSVLGLSVVVILSLTIKTSSALVNDLLAQIALSVMWVSMTVLGVLILVAYVVALRNAFIQSRGIKLARKLRRNL